MALYSYALPLRMAGHWMAPPAQRSGRRYLRLNIRDEGEDFVLTAHVPGVKAEDLRIQVLGDAVRIEGAAPSEEVDYLLREINTGPFVRELRLPSPLQADKIEARVEDGMLTLRLPKAESARPRIIKIAAK